MKLKQNEISYLKQIKRSSGLSEVKIFQDIKNLNNSQFTFDKIEKQIKKLKKLIELKNKKIISLELRIKKLKEDNFKERFRGLEKKEYNHGSLNNLKRILRNLNKGETYTQTDISKNLLIGSNDVKGCLSLLKELNLIEIKEGNCVRRYCLK